MAADAVAALDRGAGGRWGRWRRRADQQRGERSEEERSNWRFARCSQFVAGSFQFRSSPDGLSEDCHEDHPLCRSWHSTCCWRVARASCRKALRRGPKPFAPTQTSRSLRHRSPSARSIWPAPTIRSCVPQWRPSAANFARWAIPRWPTLARPSSWAVSICPRGQLLSLSPMHRRACAEPPPCLRRRHRQGWLSRSAAVLTARSFGRAGRPPSVVRPMAIRQDWPDHSPMPCFWGFRASRGALSGRPDSSHSV